jgi:hypothetical protein
MSEYVYLSEALIGREFGYKEQVFEDETGKHKKLILEGVFSTAGKVNRNKREYSESLLRREASKLNSKIQESGGLLGELEHPMGNPEDPVYMQRATKVIQERACVIMKEQFDWRGMDVWGKAEILDGDGSFGDKLAAHVRHGHIPGISSRGVGGKPTYTGAGSIMVPESYNMITYDIVTDPSNYNSRLNMMLEEEIFRIKESEKYNRKLWTGFEVLANKVK